MSNISYEASSFLIHSTTYKNGDTRVVHISDKTSALMVNNKTIATFTIVDLLDESRDILRVCAKGSPTRKILNRLNAIPGVSVHQRGEILYLNGRKWDGSWEDIS